MIVVAWIVFFLTSVGGHMTLTLQTRAHPMPHTAGELVRYAVAPWSLATVVCWGASTVLWLLLLEKHGLSKAASVSSLRYVLIVLAAGLVLRESLGVRDMAGAALIAAGIWLVTLR